MWFHIIFELDQAKPSGLDQDYLKYSDYAVVTGNPININFLEFLIFKEANGAKKSFNSWWMNNDTVFYGVMDKFLRVCCNENIEKWEIFSAPIHEVFYLDSNTVLPSNFDLSILAPNVWKNIL